jgi:hypothetical protein
MTTSMHASLTAIGRHLHAFYLPMLAMPLPSELKDLVAEVVALEIGKRRSNERSAMRYRAAAVVVSQGVDRATD